MDKSRCLVIKFEVFSSYKGCRVDYKSTMEKTARPITGTENLADKRQRRVKGSYWQSIAYLISSLNFSYCALIST